MHIGDIIIYKKGGEIKQSTISAFGFQASFIEVYLENGDTITDNEIIEIK